MATVICGSQSLTQPFNGKVRFFPLTPTPPSHSHLDKDKGGRRTAILSEDGSEAHEQVWEDENGMRKVRVRSWHCGMGGGRGDKGVHHTASSLRSSVNGAVVPDQQHQLVPASTSKENKQPHNLFILETALRTSYRAGFRDALKLSPFMPFSSSSSTTTSEDQIPLTATVTATSNTPTGEKNFSTPLLILCTSAILLGTTTSAILAYRSLGRFRSLERRLDKSLSLIWSMDNNTTEGIRKLNGELKSVKGLVLDSSPLIGLRDKSLVGIGPSVIDIGVDKKGVIPPTPPNAISIGDGDQGSKTIDSKKKGNVISESKKSLLTEDIKINPALPSTHAIQPMAAEQLKSIDRRLSEIQNAFKDFVQDSDDHWRAVFTLEEQVSAMGGDVKSILAKLENLEKGMSSQMKDRQQRSDGEQSRTTCSMENDKKERNEGVDTKEQVSSPLSKTQIPAEPVAAAIPAPTHEIMPINDIRKAIEDIKASYLVDETKVDKVVDDDKLNKTDISPAQSAGPPPPPVNHIAQPATPEAATIQIDNRLAQTEATDPNQVPKSTISVAADSRTAAKAESASTVKETEPSPPKAASTTSTTSTKAKGRALPDISDKMTNLRIDTSGLWTISPYIRHSQTADDKTGMRIGRGSWPPEPWFPSHWGCGEQRMAEVILSFDERGWLEHRSGRGNKRPTSYAFQTKICGVNDPNQGGGRIIQIFIDGRWWVVRNEPLCDTFEDRWTIRQRLHEGYEPSHGLGFGHGHEDGWLESAERALSRWIRFK